MLVPARNKDNWRRTGHQRRSVSGYGMNGHFKARTFVPRFV